MKAFRNEMLVEPLQALLNKPDGFREMVMQRDFDNLKNMYGLYKEEQSSLKPIYELYRQFIKEQGLILVKAVDPNDQKGEPLGIKELINQS